ncbi:MAG: branched-chain amino acid ABC transporter permease [Anaerolineaceae bacterium]|nr:branched-chain amino acid ABC transporter permease [Anaerolineaceae bacterium]
MSTVRLRPLVKSISPAFPVVFGYLPIGFAYGVLANNAGLSVFQTVLMSIIVYAGSSQLIAVGLFAQAVEPISIIITTFIVNLRHLLMSAALAPYLRQWKNWQVFLFSFEITDESFGIHSLRFEQGENQAGNSIRINMICQTSWVLGSFLGAGAGTLITDIEVFALDYALPAMFIALLILQIRKKTHVWVAVISAILSIMLWVSGATQWHVIIATVIGATIGAGVETWQKKQS